MDQWVSKMLKKSYIGRTIKDMYSLYYRASSERQWTTQDDRRRIFYSQFIGKNDLVFDVGANVGNRVKVFLKLGAHVIAVEPQNYCYKVLKCNYGLNPRIKIIKAALGEKPGISEIHISNSSVLSTLSNEWINATTRSGRFTKYRWEETESCIVMTLDELINHYGVPVFIKIDVEGYEKFVLKGLTQKSRFLSFEFTPELLENTFSCIRHLCDIGEPQFNYSLGESMKLYNENWVPADQLINQIAEYSNDNRLFGDIYASYK